MTAEEIITLVQPDILIHFDEDLARADGTVLVARGTLAGIKLRRHDWAGYDIAVYDTPTAGRPCASVTPTDLAGKVRVASADEERSWIASAA